MTLPPRSLYGGTAIARWLHIDTPLECRLDSSPCKQRITGTERRVRSSREQKSGCNAYTTVLYRSHLRHDEKKRSTSYRMSTVLVGTTKRASQKKKTPFLRLHLRSLSMLDKDSRGTTFRYAFIYAESSQPWRKPGNSCVCAPGARVLGQCAVLATLQKNSFLTDGFARLHPVNCLRACKDKADGGPRDQQASYPRCRQLRSPTRFLTTEQGMQRFAGHPKSHMTAPLQQKLFSSRSRGDDSPACCLTLESPTTKKRASGSSVVGAV